MKKYFAFAAAFLGTLAAALVPLAASGRAEAARSGCAL